MVCGRWIKITDNSARATIGTSTAEGRAATLAASHAGFIV
jgi:hypothetical protein